MKLANYRRSDIEQAIELKKMIQHQISTIEMCNWTDQLEEAILRTENVLQNLQLLRQMKMEKVLDNRENMMVAKLKSQGVNAMAFRFTHKKTD
ncbi:hypothetical protein NCCP2716_27340 [Sporosarcina sp. NCCP-2716]|uniref:hypothetical protein n=1 Tax=Sporosarcina sp. NCCP-2716 TaxID=2943679 RepID=UPI00203FE633|nr:hypothetical protein [Sporosarcina sp. NCCP-2716]GKV70236.1 hypothetical protein NCCP2716_27340 [Sporosarcina sp. NCCP-2716]